MPDPLVRDAVPDDAPGIAQMHADAWRAAYAHIVPPEAMARLSVPKRTVSWRKALEHPPPAQWTLVAAAGGRVVGFACGGPNRETEPSRASELYGLYVAPDRWAEGIGTLLMADSLVRLRARGDRLAVLWMLEKNDRARRFYTSRGWTLDGGRQPIAMLDGAIHPIEVRLRYALANGG